jgi:hypothetical protein
MLKAKLERDGKFFLYISTEKFELLWDDSYEDEDGHDMSVFAEEVNVGSSFIDLDSFIGEMVFSCLDADGEECEDVNNEFFENSETVNCNIKSCANGIMIIFGQLVELGD